MINAYHMVLPATNGATRINSFALVTYIPEPLGSFLDGIRRELERDAPHCRSHVTLLPPRPVSDAALACAEIEASLAAIPGFVVEAGAAALFQTTSVVYLAVSAGRDELIRAHDRLNAGVAAQVEAFPYCPHITLAQNLLPAEVEPALHLARLRWADYRGPRRFPVEALTFVQNTAGNRWVDVKEWAVARA